MYLNRLRLFDHVIALAMGFVGFAVGHTLPTFQNAYIDTGAMLIGLLLWGSGAVGVKYIDRLQVVEQKQEPEVIEPRKPLIDFNRILNPPEFRSAWQERAEADPEPENEVVAIASELVTDGVRLREAAQRQMAAGAVQELDPRIVSWAYGVTYLNAPMTQAFWCEGPNKMFTRPAYVAWVTDLYKDKILALKSPLSDRSTYIPNGKPGAMYIRGLAEKRFYRPFPKYEIGVKSSAFLRSKEEERRTA